MTTRGPLKTESRFRSPLLTLVAGICLAHSVPGLAASSALPGNTAVASVDRYSALPLSFEANQGQVDPQVKYMVRGNGYTLFLTAGATVLGLRSAGNGKPTQWVQFELQGANTTPAIAGEQELAGRSNYFVGNDSTKWHANIPTFSRVRYQQVYPGVDLIYYGRQGRLENDFEVNPGVDPKVISWNLEGAEHLRVDSSGDLMLQVGDNEVRLQRPTAYQLEGNDQREIPVHYRVHGQTVGFSLGKYDLHKKLVIDPVLTYSTYLGGNGSETAYGVVLDATGNVYLTGITASTTFPSSATAFQQDYSGGGDVFVAEFNPAATGLLFATFLGGTGTDTPAGILLSPLGNIFIVGSTTSNNFPTTPGVLQPNYAGNQDAFLTEMEPDGSALIYSTYIGGTGTDFGTAAALDDAGNAYVAGSTRSTDFPARNPIQPGNVGQYDAFLIEVSPTGTLVYSTYLGGALNDYGTGVAVDNSGNVIVSGYTYSSDFPTQDALQSALSGGSDVFVTKFTPGSSTLLFSTYLGGTAVDRSTGMVVDANGSIYLTGDTQSSDFPVTANAYQSALAGVDNVFLTKLDSTGSVRVFSTLFGGGATDQATALTRDAAGGIYITGFTQSNNLPLLDSFQNILGIAGAGNCGSSNLINVPDNLCSDAFVTKFTPSGTPVFSSFLGGSGNDSGQGIAVDAAGAIYVVGGTASTNFPVTYNAYQWQYLGTSTGSTAFLTKISPDDAASVAISPQQINFGTEPLQSASSPVTITLTNMGNAALSIGSITTSGDFSQTNNCGSFVSGGAGSCTIQVVFKPSSVGLQTGQITINDNSGNGVQGITVTGNGVLSGGSLIFTPTKLTFGAQTVGTTSANQSAVLLNNGNRAVTITNISLLSTSFAQTNNCGINFPATPATLNVGQSCSVSVNFTPSASGSVTGSVNVTSNAVNAATNLALLGTGSPVFSLSSNTRSQVLMIGSQSAQFTITASGPSTLRPNSITLKCSGSAVCNFSSGSLSPGGSSIVTVTGLSASSANPFSFTVTGTANNQTANVALSIFFADFSLTATPSGTTVRSGSSATYTVSVSPVNGFNLPVLLSCPAAYPGIPIGSTCYWSPPSVVPSGVVGSAVTSTLTVTTSAQSRLLPHSPPPGIPPGLARWVFLLALLTFLSAIIAGFSKSKLWARPQLRLAVLLATVALAALAVGCETYVNPININPVVNGTPSGNYGIQLIGTLGNGTGVQRGTSVTLSVVP
jgi:hypothetical protein